MAYWIDNTDSDQTGNTKAFMCDAASDISSLPTSSAEGGGDDIVARQKVAKGSSCLCLGEGTLYILNSSDIWVQL